MTIHTCKTNRTPARAFSLAEVLASTAVIGILATVIFSASQGARKSAALARETAAARALLNGYQLAAQETGEYLPGYDRTVGEITWPGDVTASGPAAHRYPFRLGPYIDYKVENILLVNETLRQINKSDTYSLSLSPSFGINYLYVGGEKASDGSLSLPDEVASRPAHGANILVFASAARAYGGSVTHGHCLLTPPRVYSELWSTAEWNPSSSPGDYGHVHARHNGRAVCAFLDGSVRLLDIAALRDMRLWSMRAAHNNDPHYQVQPPRPTGGRGR